MRPLTQTLAVSSDNFYGTPKPPAEPSPAAPPLNVSEALLPGARPSAQGKRKRNQSVSNMEQRTSLEPPEEEEEESPVVNGNGVAITPGTAGRERKQQFPLVFFPVDLLLIWGGGLTRAVTMMGLYNAVFSAKRQFCVKLSPELVVAVSLAGLSKTRERSQLS